MAAAADAAGALPYRVPTQARMSGTIGRKQIGVAICLGVAGAVAVGHFDGRVPNRIDPHEAADTRIGSDSIGAPRVRGRGDRALACSHVQLASQPSATIDHAQHGSIECGLAAP